jgi:hypothetical protein
MAAEGSASAQDLDLCGARFCHTCCGQNAACQKRGETKTRNFAFMRMGYSNKWNGCRRNHVLPPLLASVFGAIDRRDDVVNG